MPRIGSPPFGSSSLMTSAPQSLRTAVVDGPATHIASSTTLMPESGASMRKTPPVVASRELAERDRLRQSIFALTLPFDEEEGTRTSGVLAARRDRISVPS